MFGFAKLKGYSPWPAKKLGQSGGKVWVRFFGKNQLGTISRKNWTDLSPESHETIGLKNDKKAGYATALELMTEASKQNLEAVDDITDHLPGVDIIVEPVNEVHGQKVNLQKSAKSKIKKTKKCDKNRAQTKSAFAKKTLQDSEREVLKNFSEKIVREKSGFSCKGCKFSSALELRAKTHAMTCGRKFKKVASHKKSSCPECESVFSNKKDLFKHYKTEHPISKYKCSKCLKAYRQRKTYLAHLKFHEPSFLNQFHCDLCNYKGVSNWNLKRHKDRKHRDTSMPSKLKQFRCDLCNYKCVSNWNLKRHKGRNHRDTFMDVSSPVEIEAIIFESDASVPQFDNEVTTNEITEINNELSVGSANDEINELNNVNNNELIEVNDKMPNDGDDITEVTAGDDIAGVTAGDGITEVTASDEFTEVPAGGDDIAGVTEVQDQIPSGSGTSNLCDLETGTLSRYELIRLSIIQEREQMIADSGIMESISEAKNDLIDRNKNKRKNEISRNKARVNDQIPMRRSLRVTKPVQVSDTAETISNTTEEEYDYEIEIEFEVNGDSADVKTREAQNDNNELDIEIEKILDQILKKVVETREAQNDNSELTKEIMKIMDQMLKKVVNGESDKFQCSKCGYKARDNYNLKRHIEIMHSNGIIKCLICNNVFSDKFVFDEHTSDCFRMCPYDNCVKRFKFRNKLEAHKRMHIKQLRRY